MRRAAACALAVLAALLLSAPTAIAGAPNAPDVARAKTLFKAGAQAYSDNDFGAALHAFQAARAILPDPALTFSIAQAQRRQYQQKRFPRHLRAAVAEYKRYLAEVERGGRRGDAAEALVELEPKLQALDLEEQPAAAPSRMATRLMVLSSVDGALVSVDDAPPEAAPFIGEIEPGRHAVRVVAPGYRPYVRSVQIRAGDVAPIDAQLEELPAQLLVRGDSGATLWVDGRSFGALPLAAPVAVPPGRRLVSVTKDGYRRFELETLLERADQKELDVLLETTAQRSVGIVALALGGASLIAGGVFAGVAGATYADTKEIYDRSEHQTIDAGELADYTENRDAHEPWMVASLSAGAAGLALGVTGGLLLLLDKAVPPSQIGVRRGRSGVRHIGIMAAPSPQGGHVGLSLQF